MVSEQAGGRRRWARASPGERDGGRRRRAGRAARDGLLRKFESLRGLGSAADEALSQSLSSRHSATPARAARRPMDERMGLFVTRNGGHLGQSGLVRINQIEVLGYFGEQVFSQEDTVASCSVRTTTWD